jgi:type I restriction enzyme, S subunit
MHSASRRSAQSQAKKFARKGDILVTVKGSGVGSINVVDIQEVARSRQLVAVRAKAAEPRYVELCLSIQGDHFQKRASGAAIPGLSRHDILDLEIPLPPLEEQKRIVAVLDQAFAALDRARAHAEANLADAVRLAALFLDDQISTLFAEFGRIRIDDLADVKGGKRLPKGETTQAERTPYPYISVRDMNDAGTANVATVGFISPSVQRAIKRYTISTRDVYVSIAGTIGKTGVIPESLDGANLTENAAKLVLSKGWDRDFVYWATRSTHFRDQVVEQTRIAAQPKLALQRLGSITIPKADERSQRKLVGNMVRFREAMIRLKSAYEGKLSETASLRQSLLHSAFAGRLTA